MDGSTIIFYLLAALTLGSAVMAVTSRQIFRSAISLLFSLVGVAGIYFWMQYEFIAAVQIVVYVGGIVVLIIFSIFLTQQAGEKMAAPKPGRILFSALAAFCGLALTMVQVFQHTFTGTTKAPLLPTVRNIGNYMLSIDETGYALPFEVVSMLLLAAMVGCIVIAIRTPSEPAGEKTKEETGTIEIIKIEPKVFAGGESTGGLQ
ncbi:MAG TPA: NADH-quinone oxidoreductase subunit J [Flavisolibacter sp.]